MSIYPPHAHRQLASSASRIPELLDQLKADYEALAHDVNTYRMQRDECERKLESQIQEITSIQQGLYDLERTHTKLKQQYEEEIMRLRRQLDAATAGRPSEFPASGPSRAPENSSNPAVLRSANGPGIPGEKNAMAAGMLHGGPLPVYYSPPNVMAPIDGKRSYPPPPVQGPGGPHGPPAAKRPRPDNDNPPWPGGQGGPFGPGPGQPVDKPKMPELKKETGDMGFPIPSALREPGAAEKSSNRIEPGPPMIDMAEKAPQPQMIGRPITSPHDLPQQDISGKPGSGPMGPLGGPPNGVGIGMAAPPSGAGPGIGIDPSDKKSSSPSGPPMEDGPKPGSNDETVLKDGGDWFVHYNPAVQVNFGMDLLHTLEHESVVCCVVYSGDGKYLATGCNKTAQVFDVESGDRVGTFCDELIEGPKGGEHKEDSYVRAVCFSPDARFLAAGAEDRIVKVWDIENRRTRHTLVGHELDIYSLNFSHDGRLLVSGSGDRKAKLWDMVAGKCLFTLGNEDLGPKDGVTSVAMSPDGRFVAAGSLDRIVRLWDTNTGVLLDRFEGHSDSVYSVAFSPDGRSLASGSLDKTLKLWDLTTAPRTARSRCRSTFNGHKDFVLSVTFSPDGAYLVSGSKDRTVQFWDLRTAIAHLMLQGHKNSVISVAMSRHGGLFATGSGDYRARVWKYESFSSSLRGPR